ncbi:MAG: ABC transporter six-transmembrane domain-containing protein [Elainella sp.]
MASTTMQTLQGLFTNYRWSILRTYGLTLLENLFELLYPWAIGVAIDGLLQKDYASLLPLAIAWIIHTFIGVSRQIYDTSIFTRIYGNLATSVVLEQARRGVSTSQIVARSALSREFVDFFEQDIPQIITTLFSFIGALAMLYLYDSQIGSYCLILLLPLLVINHIYARRSRRLNRRLNDQLESEVEVLSKPAPAAIDRHYRLLAKWRIRLSNAEAANWGVMELFVIALSVVVLIRTVTLPHTQPGEIYAVIAYFWNYVSSLDDVPRLVQQFSRLQDIGERMQVSELELSEC